MELQLLLDRVTSLENNVDRVLCNQNEILSRLSALEKQSACQQTATQPNTSFPRTTTQPNTSILSFNERDDFSFNEPPMYIPPPPRHAPPSLSLDYHGSAENRTPLREYQAQHCTPIHHKQLLPRHNPQLLSSESAPPPQQDQAAVRSHAQSRGEPHSLFNPPPHPPKRFVLAGNLASGDLVSRAPFQPITNQVNTIPATGVPLIHEKPGNVYLPSSAINKQKLKSASKVILRYPKLRNPSNVGTLATKLAREAYFGEDVLAKCTVAGDRGLPGLPIEELRQLKQTLFAQFPTYWRSPHEFEPLWTTATTSVGQLCKRLRLHGNSSTVNL